MFLLFRVGGHHEMKVMKKGGVVRLLTTTEEDEGHVQQRGKITPQTAALISGRLPPADYRANTPHQPQDVAPQSTVPSSCRILANVCSDCRAGARAPLQDTPPPRGTLLIITLRHSAASISVPRRPSSETRPQLRLLIHHPDQEEALLRLYFLPADWGMSVTMVTGVEELKLF